MDDGRMSLRAYARSRKIPLSTAQKALETGRIRRESDGKILASKADREWLENTRPRVDGRVPVAPPRQLRTMSADELADCYGHPLSDLAETASLQEIASLFAQYQDVLSEKLEAALDHASKDIARVLLQPEQAERIRQRLFIALAVGFQETDKAWRAMADASVAALPATPPAPVAPASESASSSAA